MPMSGIGGFSGSGGGVLNTPDCGVDWPCPPSVPGFQVSKEPSSSRGMNRAYGDAGFAPSGGGTLRNVGFDLEELIVTAAAQHDLAFVRQSANDLQHFLLLGFDF